MDQLKYKLLAGVATAVFALPTMAQDQADSAASEDGDVNIEEVIVTATRREEKLQDVPAAVLSIEPEAFTLTGKTSIKDIIRYEPGLLFDDGGNAGRGTITARGVPQLGSTPVFATYIDDMPLTSNTPYNQGAYISLDGLLLDVERVEIVKGPQGTLFGATSVGGMMRYVTKKPALEEVRGTATVDINSVKGGGTGQTYNGRVSVPLIKDKLGLSVGAFHQETAGLAERIDPATGNVLENNVGGSEVQGYAADLLFQATDKLEIRVKYLRQETDTDDSYLVDLASVDSTDGAVVDFGTVTSATNIDLVSDYISGAINYEFDGFTLTSSTSWSKLEQDVVVDVTASFAGFVDLLTGQAPGTTTEVLLDSPLSTEKFVQEVRLTSDESDTFEWLIGGYYADETGANIQDGVVAPTPPITLFYADFPSAFKELAGFGNFTYYLTDNFDIGGGIRVAKNEVDFDFFTDGVLTVGFGPAITVNQTLEDTVTTYLANARWRPTDDLSLYARIASGYRGAAPNFVAVDPFTGEPLSFPVVEADSAWSYEVGAKGAALDGKLGYDISAYYIDFSEFQTGFSANGVGILANSEGGLKSKGFDASFTYTPSSSFLIKTNFGYANSQLNADEPGFGGIANVQVPGVPKWKASVQWNYSTEAFNDWQADFGGGVRYIGGYDSTYTFGTAQSVWIDERTVTDLNLSLSNDNWRFGVYVTNLFDVRKLTNRTDNIIALDPVSMAPVFYSEGQFEMPRTIGGNLTFSF